MGVDPQSYIGSVIKGRYFINGLIGTGGFAWVLRGKSREGRPVAVKVLHSVDMDALSRFLREIKVLRALPRNPHVVEYIDDGRTEDGRPFLVLEFVEGKTLMQEMMKKRRRDPRDAVVFLTELCEAFVELHQLGVAHRDVKPENILLAQDGMIKLIDFGLIRDAQGLLKLFEENDPLEPRRFSDEIDHRILIGTPEYMAPEQFSDAIEADAASVRTDTWSDVFSLGVILFELIAGEVPFPIVKTKKKSQMQAAVFKYMKWRIDLSDADIPTIDEVDESLDTILSKALRYDPRQRQPNAQAFKADLKRYIATGRGVRRAYDTHTVAMSQQEIEEYRIRREAERSQKPPPQKPAPEKQSASKSSISTGSDISPSDPPEPETLSAPDTLLGAPPWLNQPAVFSLEEPAEDLWDEPVEALLEQLALDAEDAEEEEPEETITKTKDEPPLVVQGKEIVVDDDVGDVEATAIRHDSEIVAKGDTDEIVAKGDTDEIVAKGDTDEIVAKGDTDEIVAKGDTDGSEDIPDQTEEINAPPAAIQKRPGSFVIIDLPPSGKPRKEASLKFKETEEDDRAVTDTVPVSLPEFRKADTIPGSPPPSPSKPDTLPGSPPDTSPKSDPLPGSQENAPVKAEANPVSTGRVLLINADDDDDIDPDDAVTSIKGSLNDRSGPYASTEVTSVFPKKGSEKKRGSKDE